MQDNIYVDIHNICIIVHNPIFFPSRLLLDYCCVICFGKMKMFGYNCTTLLVREKRERVKEGFLRFTCLISYYFLLTFRNIFAVRRSSWMRLAVLWGCAKFFEALSCWVIPRLFMSLLSELKLFHVFQLKMLIIFTVQCNVNKDVAFCRAFVRKSF